MYLDEKRRWQDSLSKIDFDREATGAI